MDKSAELIANIVSSKLDVIYKKLHHLTLAGERELNFFSIGAATTEIVDLIKEDLTINNIHSLGGVNGDGMGFIKVYL